MIQRRLKNLNRALSRSLGGAAHVGHSGLGSEKSIPLAPVAPSLSVSPYGFNTPPNFFPWVPLHISPSNLACLATAIEVRCSSWPLNIERRPQRMLCCSAKHIGAGLRHQVITFRVAWKLGHDPRTVRYVPFSCPAAMTLITW